MTKTLEINKMIIQVLCNYLSYKCGSSYTYEGFDNETIEIFAFSKVDFDDKFSIIRIGIQNDFQQIYIPNIFIPPLLRYNRVGKTLIRLVYEIGFNYGYDVFVVQLTDGFRKKLLNRGALETNEYDILQIVNTTNLLDQQD